MKTYNAQQVSDATGIGNKSVRNRAIKLGMKKLGRDWEFNQDEFNLIKNYVKPPVFRSAFYFSTDGQYLILNSRMNQYESQINRIKSES